MVAPGNGGEAIWVFALLFGKPFLYHSRTKRGDHQVIYWDGTSSFTNVQFILIAHLFNVLRYS